MLSFLYFSLLFLIKFNSFIFIICAVVGFWYGAKLLIYDIEHDCHHNCLTGGTVISVFFCVLVGSSGLGQLSPPLTAFFSAKSAASQIYEIINRQPLIDSISDLGEKPIEVPRGEIEITDVVFAYPSRPNIFVCQGYSLSVKSGEIVALCGPSGCGKVSSSQIIIK